MVAVPQEASWSFRVLGSRDRQRVLAYLNREPLMNVFLISKILDEGLGVATPTVEIAIGGTTICVASVGSNIVGAVDREASPTLREIAIGILADKVITQFLPVRAIIAEANFVESLWARLRAALDPPTVVRLNQPVYALEQPATDFPDLGLVRFSTTRDLDALVPACAAMHREEVGIDPLERDAAAYRRRVRELVARQRSLILPINGKIAFKCEYSAVTDHAVQLMGVWTAPELRRQGWARAGLAEVCGHIRRTGKIVTLFVNDFNAPAIRLYEALGFRAIGNNRALIW